MTWGSLKNNGNAVMFVNVLSCPLEPVAKLRTTALFYFEGFADGGEWQ
jgi:hypothetical protein